MKNRELKPCPFCGSEARVYSGYTDCCGVTCQKCTAKVYGYKTIGGAKRAWNRRAENGKS